MTMRRRIRAVAVPAALLCAGCAVLTVEVDVYKGPLANQGEVQMAQVVTMAMGVKPLLVALRDDLEWGNEAAVGAPARFRGEWWYRDGWIAPLPVAGGGPGRVPLMNEDARRVNDVLSLYEDQSRLAPYAAALRDAAGELDRACKAFYTQDPAAADAAALVETAERPAGYLGEGRVWSDELRAVCAAFLRGAEDKSARHERRVLEVSSQGLRRRASGRPGAAAIGTDDVAGKATAAEAAVAALSRAPWSPTNWSDDVAQSSNAIFSQLADRHTAHLLAAAMVADATHQTAVASAITARAQSYFDCRRAIRATLLAALDLIERVDESTEIQDDERRRLLGLLAEPMERLVQSVTLVAALHGDAAGRPLLDRILAQPVDAPADRTQRRTAWARALAGELATPGLAAPAARVVRSADVRIRAEAPAAGARVDRDDLRRLQGPAYREFGVASGPITADGAADDGSALLEAAARAMAASAVVGSSLAGGRTPEGLETRIRNYLNAYYAQPLAQDGTGSPLVAERARLLHALIEFGTKVTVMANDAAISRARDGESLVSYGRNLAHSVSGALPARRLDAEYIRTLQAAGNSIIAQADPLYRLMEHRRTVPVLYQTARNAAGDVAGLVPAGAEATPAAFDALELALSKAEAEAACAAAEQPTEANRTCAEARKKARELVHSLRLRSVFVPSPAAYLRTSYTSSAVQDSDGITWSNDLRTHLGHSWPLEQIVAWFTTDASATLAEVDRQYWQNINRVQVSAAGNTNYVIAKDDIGNWYVKGFEGDPKPLVDAAKAVAGSAIGAGGFVVPSAVNAPGAPPPAFSREAVAEGFLSLRSRFDTATDAHVAALAEIARELPDTLVGAWKAYASGAADKPSAAEILQQMAADELAARRLHLGRAQALATVAREDAFATDGRIAEALAGLPEYGARVAKLLGARHAAATQAKATATAAAETAAVRKTAAETARNTATGKLPDAVKERDKARIERDGKAAALKQASEPVPEGGTPYTPEQMDAYTKALGAAETDLATKTAAVAKLEQEIAKAEKDLADAAAEETRQKAVAAKADADIAQIEAALGDVRSMVTTKVQDFLAGRRQALAAFKSGIEAFGVVETE